MTVVLEMPFIYKMIKNSKEVEDFTHNCILEKYKVEVKLFEKEGMVEIKPKIIDQRKV